MPSSQLRFPTGKRKIKKEKRRRKKNEERKEEKSEGKEVITKKARAALAVGHLLQPFATVLRVEQAIALGLSAAPAGFKEECEGQCTTEFP